MISSMTGFGRGCAQTDKKKIRIEIKSLNSKQLDLSFRVPTYFKEFEVTMRNDLAVKLQRGKVELTATIESLVAEPTSFINVEMLKCYKQQLENVAKQLEIEEPQDWYSILMRLPDSMKTEISKLTQEDSMAFVKACNQALDELSDFRRKEGEKLYYFFIDKINNIANLLESVTQYEESRVLKIKERLEEQLSRLESIEFDKSRLEQELIFYIEKLDVTEEKVRLKNHLSYFMETLGDENELPSDGNGKKLGFIAQEMGREINTLGSKSNNAEMQKIVVKMKDELEQIKEQVLNVL